VKEKIVRILSRKLMIALIAISMATFPALRANAQAAAAGTIAGVGATTAIIVGVVVVGAVAANNNDSGRPDTFPSIPQAPASPATPTTADAGGGGSTTTTTTTN
jgi:hypothetical protein